MVAVLIALLTVWLGYRLGLVSYLRRREHELIIQRYLEQGVDQLTANFDHALCIFRENWAHSLRMLREFRGTVCAGIPARKETYSQGFLSYEPQSFFIQPFYKVSYLVGNNVFWHRGQDLFAFIGSAYDFFENDLRLALVKFCNHEMENTDPKQLYETYLKEVLRLNQESDRFYTLLKHLQNLASILETKQMSFKDLHKVRDHEQVLNALKEIEETFPPDVNQDGAPNSIEQA
jgi:hypothetical protein